MSNAILTDILIIFAVAVPVAFLFHKIKLPPIIGLLVTVLIIGPSGLGLVQDASRINLLAQIGIALLVFSLGLEFSLKHFGGVKLVVLGGGALQIILSTATVLIIAVLFGIGWRDGLFLGCALSLSSTAVVYYLLSQKRLIDSPHGRIATGMLILQDLSAIPMIALLPLVFVPGDFIASADIIQALLKIAVVAGVFFAGGWRIL